MKGRHHVQLPLPKPSFPLAWAALWPQVILLIGVGGAIGVVGGGIVGQMLYNRRKWTMPIFIGKPELTCALAVRVCNQRCVHGSVGTCAPLGTVRGLGLIVTLDVKSRLDSFLAMLLGANDRILSSWHRVLHAAWDAAAVGAHQCPG